MQKNQATIESEINLNQVKQQREQQRPKSHLSQHSRPSSKKSVTKQAKQPSLERVIEKNFERYDLKISLRDDILYITNKSRQSGQIYEGVYKFDDINELTRVFFDSMDDLFNELSNFYKEFLQVLQDGSIKFKYTFNNKSRIVPFSLSPKEMDKYEQLIQMNSILRKQLNQVKSKIPVESQQSQAIKAQILQIIEQLRSEFKQSQQKQDSRINEHEKKIFDTETEIRQILKSQHQNQESSLIGTLSKDQFQQQKNNHEKILAMEKKRENQLLELRDRHEGEITSLKGKLEQINLHLLKATQLLQNTASKVEASQNSTSQLKQKQEQVRRQLDQQIDNNFETFELVSEKVGIPYLGFKKIHIQVDTQTETFRKCYEYSKATRKVTSKGYGCYYSIVGKEPLPKTGRFYFQIYAPKSLHQNALHVGIITQQDRLKQKALSSSQAIYLNNFDRRIVETGQTNVYASDHVTSGTLVTVMIDTVNRKIGWHYKQKIQAVKELKQLYLKNKVYPVFALYHNNTDAIQIK